LQSESIDSSSFGKSGRITQQLDIHATTVEAETLTSLQHAIKHNFLKDVEKQLQRDNADVNAQSREGSALDIAIRYSRTKALQLLLQHPNLNPNSLVQDAQETCSDDGIRQVTSTEVAWIIDQAKGVAKGAGSVSEPLHEALIQDQIESARLLLGHPDIDVNRVRRVYRSDQENNSNETALDIAVRMGQQEVVQMLLEKGAISAKKGVIIRLVRVGGLCSKRWKRLPMVY
jgi:ankyrin repeat protein